MSACWGDRRMKRAFAISAVSTLAFVAILLHSVIKDFLWTHPWWHSFLVALPTIGLPILGMFLEERRSREAGTLQAKADDLQAQLDAERNKHLQQIARNTEKPVTQAERNADILRKHLRAKVSVTEGQGYWPSPPEIVEVEDNIVALFSPSSYFSSSAGCVRVHCDELEITDIPDGSCPLRLKVLKRYGQNVPLGQITKWEDRSQPAATPVFAKGDMAYRAAYGKQGSPETRGLLVYASSDGTNSFLLQATTGETIMGNNEEISKRFMGLHIDYLAAGFNRSSSGSGSSQHRLFIC